MSWPPPRRAGRATPHEPAETRTGPCRRSASHCTASTSQLGHRWDKHRGQVRLEEVIARLRGLLRRAGAAAAPGAALLTVGDLSMDEDSREVRRDEELIELTATEFELLRFLMRNPRRVLSEAQILDQVWQYDFGGQANVVELYISYLRKKIDAGRALMIHTVRGAGYVLKPAG